ncbi:basic proline-rich protein-like [Grus japonensis]|uniref:Basic proline-rich protein-like n=1 Tax=Grus japonensis TaxID=30415 RepID=A0ABC9YB84_GRUJA
MGGGRGARDPPASDSEKDSGFSDASSEHRDRRERTDAEELPDAQPAPPQHPLGAPAAPGYHPFARLAPVYLVHNVLLQQPLGAPPEPWQPARLLLLQPPPPSASHQDTAVARHDATATVAPVGNPGCRSRRLGVTAELLRRGGLLAAALRTGALLRQNRRTQREIVALRRHTRLLARAACDPRVWPRLRDALGGGGPPVPPAPRQDPPAFGEGVGAGGL